MEINGDICIKIISIYDIVGRFWYSIVYINDSLIFIVILLEYIFFNFY